ncbi:MAG: 3TM-type holin [Alphaproteobacteria bacterium]
MGILAVLAPLLDRILGAVLPDNEARQKAILDALGKMTDGDIEQLKVNAVEAASTSLFVAGWRPAIGWCCAFALFYQYLLLPIGLWICRILGQAIDSPPVLDGALWELMFGMLGLGALRTIEKVKGISVR